MNFSNYLTQGFYDEVFDENDTPRPGAELLIKKIESLPENDLLHKQKSAEAALLQLGNTFAVYRTQDTPPLISSGTLSGYGEAQDSILDIYEISNDGNQPPKGFNYEKPDSTGMELIRILIKQLHAKVELICENGVTYKIKFKTLKK